MCSFKVDISLKVKESHEFFSAEIFTFDKERERNSAYVLVLSVFA